MKTVNIKNSPFFLLYFLSLMITVSCESYLDVVPEGVATLESAFSMRAQAKKYLYTCYSYMLPLGHPASDPAIMGGDELWTIESEDYSLFAFNGVKIARGQQNATTPLLDYWGRYYQGIRDCNIFIENAPSIPDIPEWEREQWIGEAKFIKAYYHFCLLQMYGPVPLIRTNLSIDAGIDEVRVPREPVDECFAYIVRLLDEAIPALPLDIADKATELGRPTQAIALSLKAKVLVTAASPLFNGNAEQAPLRNPDGTQLFNTTYMPEKWRTAANACAKAVRACEEAGMKLYEYPGNPRYALTDTIMTQMSLRGAFGEEWNSELIWANTKNLILNTNLTESFTYIDPSMSRKDVLGGYGVPMKIVEMFYSENGVPIEEDNSLPWKYNQRYSLRMAMAPEKLYIKEGRTTVNLHFNREPRFYAWVGFDGGIWYGHNKYDDREDLFYSSFKMGEAGGKQDLRGGPVTAYLPKKYVHPETYQYAGTGYTVHEVAVYWPMFRLSDLYLLFAEALNETTDSQEKRDSALIYVNRIRERAGLKDVKFCWDTYTSNRSYDTQNGLQKIIRQERMIELVFEGQRFWDIRRWKTAPELYGNIEGWDYMQSRTEYFYRLKTLFRQQFGQKDYFWPINNHTITVNRNLVQNIGW
jgi:hypothetical protein